MNKKFLEELGVDESHIKQIIVEHGKGLEKFKTQTATADAALKVAQEQLSDANETIEGFKKLDTEGIQRSADEWKAKATDFESQAKQAKEDGKKAVVDLKFSHALTAAVTSLGAKDPSDIMPHLAVDKITLGDDGKMTGLVEQIEGLQKSKDYLFDISSEDDSAGKNPQIVLGGNSKSVAADPVFQAAMDAAGVADPGE